MTRKIRILLTLLGAVFCLSACENAKEELGLTRSSPDEFAVVKRAPLELPPDFSLRPPAPGTPRPQEQAMAEQARETVLGTGNKQSGKTGRSSGEIALLDSAHARYNPDIRQIVDQEAVKTERKNEPVAKKLLNIGKDQLPPAKIVDPQAEAARLKTNAATGKPATEGETPAIED